MRPIGLSIKDDILSAAQIKSGRAGDLNLRGYSYRNIPAGIIKRGRILRPQTFIRQIKDLLSRPDYGTLDGRCLNISVFGQTDSDYYRSIFSQLGANIVNIETNFDSCLRCHFFDQPVPEPLLWVDIGLTTTQLVVFDASGIKQDLYLDMGVLHWRQRLARWLKTESVQAERVLDEIGLRRVRHDHNALIHAVLRPALAKLRKQAVHLENYYRWQMPDQVLTLMVQGHGARIPGLPETLGHLFGLEMRPDHYGPLPIGKYLQNQVPADHLIDLQPALGGLLNRW